MKNISGLILHGNINSFQYSSSECNCLFLKSNDIPLPMNMLNKYIIFTNYIIQFITIYYFHCNIFLLK